MERCSGNRTGWGDRRAAEEGGKWPEEKEWAFSQVFSLLCPQVDGKRGKVGEPKVSQSWTTVGFVGRFHL